MSSIFLGATINGEHTLRDWKMAINNSDILSAPEPNTVYLEVPGRNGRLDLSEALTGDVTYQNRTIKLQLGGSVGIQEWYERCLHVFNTFHGRAVQVIFDDDPTHYFKGRATVTEPQRVRNGGQFVFTVDAEPFRYELQEYITQWTVSTGTTIVGKLPNTRMPTSPTVTVPNDCELIVGDVTYALLAGENTVSALILTEGETEFTVNGASDVVFSYQRGCL